MRLRHRTARAPVQKPLCRLCECPTSDGYVLASMVDKNKLKNWAMKALSLTENDEYLPETVEDDDLICYFCLWQAEFADESGDESVAWWPRNLDLDETTKQLRRNYLKGNVEQCWVQLEELEVAEGKCKEEDAADFGQEGGNKCIYCGKLFLFLQAHVRIEHRNAIKCHQKRCTAFFHSLADLDRHFREEHSPRQRKNAPIKCQFCEKPLRTRSYKIHVLLNHPDKGRKCPLVGCHFYCGSKAEVDKHLESAH